MAKVYILKSLRTGRYYVGSTVELEGRLPDHRVNHIPSSPKPGSWKLVYQEAYDSMVRARQREREIKGWKSHRLIEQLITRSNAGKSEPPTRERQPLEYLRGRHHLSRW